MRQQADQHDRQVIPPTAAMAFQWLLKAAHVVIPEKAPEKPGTLTQVLRKIPRRGNGQEERPRPPIGDQPQPGPPLTA